MTQNKREYLVPETEVIEMQAESTICSNGDRDPYGNGGDEEW